MVNEKDLVFKHSGGGLKWLLVFSALCVLFLGLGFLIGIYVILMWKREYLMLTDKYILIRRGVFFSSTIEVPYSKIVGLNSQNAFGMKSVAIATGNFLETVWFSYVNNPKEIIDEIKKRMENTK